METWLMLGMLMTSFPVGSEVQLLNTPTSKDLYYISVENRVVKLYKVQNDRNKAVIQPQLLATFSRLKQGELVQGAARVENTVYETLCQFAGRCHFLQSHDLCRPFLHNLLQSYLLFF